MRAIFGSAVASLLVISVDAGLVILVDATTRVVSSVDNLHVDSYACELKGSERRRDCDFDFSVQQSRKTVFSPPSRA